MSRKCFAQAGATAGRPRAHLIRADALAVKSISLCAAPPVRVRSPLARHILELIQSRFRAAAGPRERRHKGRTPHASDHGRGAFLSPRARL